MRKSRVRETKRDEIFTSSSRFPPQCSRPPASARANAGAEQAFGLWRVADGSAIIRIKPCGTALCGFVAAAPAPAPGEKSAVGQKILLDLRREGDRWRGPIFNLDDGKIYDGEISHGRRSLNHLKVRGCVPGGGVCGGETWKREPEASAALTLRRPASIPPRAEISPFSGLRAAFVKQASRSLRTRRGVLLFALWLPTLGRRGSPAGIGRIAGSLVSLGRGARASL